MELSIPLLSFNSIFLWMPYDSIDLPFYDVFEEDPLINFQCQNDFCDNVFTPNLILDEQTNRAYFICPVCKTQYYLLVEFEEIIENLRSFTVIDGPYILHKGSKISTA